MWLCANYGENKKLKKIVFRSSLGPESSKYPSVTREVINKIKVDMINFKSRFYAINENGFSEHELGVIS